MLCKKTAVKGPRIKVESHKVRKLFIQNEYPVIKVKVSDYVDGD